MALAEKKSGSGDPDDGGTCDPADYSTTARTVVTRRPWVPTPLPTQDTNHVEDSQSHPASGGNGGRKELSLICITSYSGSGGEGGVCVKPNEPNPDPTDCAKFYLCANGVPHAM